MFTSSGFSIRRQICREIALFASKMISEDGKSVPPQQREWRIGQTYSWHYVRIVEYRTEQLIKEIEIVAKKSNSKGRSNGTSFEPFTFVRCELSTEDKKAAKIWIEENTADFGAKLHDVVASDYKFSVSFSAEHDTFTACLSGKEDNAINPRKTLTARHKDWLTAAMTVLYKHEVIFRGELWEQDVDADDDGWA